MLLEDLKAFVAVIDHNSLTKAADALYLTQSAVSRRIQRLEEVLEANLFDRNSKPPTPTAIAMRIYRHAVPLLRDAQYLLDVPRDNAPPTGIFRLGFTQVVADAVLFDVIRQMKTEFPGLEVKLKTDWSSSLQQQLQYGTLDAAALMLPAGGTLPEGLAGEFITRLEVLIVQSRQHPLVTSQIGIKSLSDQEWILNPHGCGYRAALERAMDSAGKSLRVSVDTHGTEMQLRMVAAGLGLGIVPRAVLQRSQSCKDLTIVEADDFMLNLDIWLAYPSQIGNLRRAIESLRQIVIHGFREQDGAASPFHAGTCILAQPGRIAEQRL